MLSFFGLTNNESASKSKILATKAQRHQDAQNVNC